MSQRDTIVLTGGYRLDKMGASAVRALGLATLFERLGYRVFILGKLTGLPSPELGGAQVNIKGISCRDIRQPVLGQAFPPYERSSRSIMAFVDEIGPERILAVCAYNYPARGLASLIRACRKRAIVPVADCTEWSGWEGRRILRNIYRQVGIEMRMRILTRLAGNVICASRWFEKKLPRTHTVRLPFVLDTARPEWKRSDSPVGPDREVRFVYSGSPGVGLRKDRLVPMLEALATLAATGHEFSCHIAGLTQEQYLEIVPRHGPLLTGLSGRVRFLGRLSHAESLDLVRYADFSVFFRKPDRVSHTGFPTKFVEAMTLGVPVITNATSDIPEYLQDGENGILAAGWGQDDIEQALLRAVSLTPEQRLNMRGNCRARNPFDVDNWRKDAAWFLENVR